MNNDHVFTVIDLPSLEVMQNLMKEPEMIKLREHQGWTILIQNNQK